MRIRLIVNPAAARVTPRSTAELIAALSQEHDVSEARTQGRDDATALAADAVRAGADAIVVYGGDGTLNEAANALTGTDVVLAIVPGGSTNVFARSLGLSRHQPAATRQLVDALGSRTTRRIGVGRVDGRCFLFCAGIGFDAAVVERIEGLAPRLKRQAGALYGTVAVHTWFWGYDHRAQEFSASANGASAERCALAIVSNANPYTYLGPLELIVSPAASLDGGLALTAFGPVGFATMASLSLSALTSRARLRHHRQVTQADSAEHVVIEGRTPIPYQLDGDFIGRAQRFTFTHEPATLTVAVPVVAS